MEKRTKEEGDNENQGSIHPAEREIKTGRGERVAEFSTKQGHNKYMLKKWWYLHGDHNLQLIWAEAF